MNCGGANPLFVRYRRIGISILLCLALGLMIFSAAEIVQAVGRLQQSRHLAQSGDVRAIRPWMTLRIISKAYRVPESYLLQSLNISDPTSVRQVTLYALAPRLHLTTQALIQKIQAAILAYRQQYSPSPPSGVLHSVIPPPAGRQRIA
jgi:hypothetical protein